MKIKELMIGDVLMAHFNDGEEEFDFPVVIDGLDENSTLVDGECEVSWHNLLPEHKDIMYAEELNYIPITEKILLDNGFHQEEEKPCKTFRVWLGDYFEDGYVLLVFHDFDSGAEIALHVQAIPPYVPSDLMIVVKYVHEMQHVLRLCRLVELANNIKV